MNDRIDYCPTCWKLLPTRRRKTGEIVVISHRRPGNEGRICTGSGYPPRAPADATRRGGGS